MIKEDDKIMIIEDEEPDTYHIISKKVGELGIIFKPELIDRFCFRQTDLNKFLKPYHIVEIARILKEKNEV